MSTQTENDVGATFSLLKLAPQQLYPDPVVHKVKVKDLLDESEELSQSIGITFGNEG